MRFAFKTSPQNTTWADMLAVWKEADDIELFESGWTFDHFYPIFSDSTGPCMEGWITLTALAQATTRLRIGTLVTGIHYRHPAVLANMATTLDIVSEGRLELGIGAGWNEEESGAYGIELGSPSERSDRFEEACEVIVGLLTQEATTFDGRTTSSARPAMSPSPYSNRTRQFASAAVVRSGRCALRRGSPSTGTSWEARRKSSPTNATSCISTARIWDGILPKYSSRATFASAATSKKQPSRLPHWPRSASSWASSFSRRP
jgi:alkanesulfonate monooxygenase SsuD/methylene tetrahydromethanopterin reductase-like flavin-dependent oxidoreductase (luciferase family)